MSDVRPLSRLRVIDFSRVVAGPLCTQYLSDLGAEVIKIEGTLAGDDTRAWPPLRGDTGAIFLSMNRNKRSVAVDMKSPEGMEIIRRLTRDADIVVESFGPGVAERLGIGYEALKALNPGLIYCSISGFGPSGPLKKKKGFDVILQAFSGIMSMTGERDEPPMRSPISPIDQATAMHTTTGVLAAVIHRMQTGLGTRIDTSLFDTSVSFISYYLQGFWERGTEPERVGTAHESVAPYQRFRTRDKHIMLGVANDSLWRAFCGIAQADHLASDARFTTNALRVRHRAEVVPAVQEVLLTRGADEWVALLDQAGVPCSTINTIGELLASPQIDASELIMHYPGDDGPAGGADALKTVAQPIRFNGARNQPLAPPPGHGEHTRAVLRENGYSDVQIVALASANVVLLGAPLTGAVTA